MEGFISELCVGESCQGAVEAVPKQLHFLLCLGFGQKICLTVTAVKSFWLCTPYISARRNDIASLSHTPVIPTVLYPITAAVQGSSQIIPVASKQSSFCLFLAFQR